MNCRDCGGDMIGDGYSVVQHCESIDKPEGVEPDAPPVHCGDQPKIDAMNRRFAELFGSLKIPSPCPSTPPAKV